MLKTGKQLLVSAMLLAATDVLACASCGSGGDDPLMLYPWETWKVYAGFAKTDGFTPINASGDIGREFGPEARNTTTVSLGHSFSHRTFATLTAPYIVNRRGPYERSGWGDPMLTGRYTLVQQDISEDWQPQVQVIAAVRAGAATSKYDSEDLAKLDIFGTGVPEWRFGVDVWHGITNVKAGLAQTVTGPLSSKKTEYGVIRTGFTYRSTATVGYGWGDRGKVMAGLNREQTTAYQLDHVRQANSDTLAHSAFVSADAKVEHHASVRVTASRAAAFARNKNTSRSDSVSVAFTRAF
jgi:hypothetical protein